MFGSSTRSDATSYLSSGTRKENFLYNAKRRSSSSFEGHPLQARHKQDWGRGFILLLPQTAALPGSDADSDVI